MVHQPLDVPGEDGEEAEQVGLDMGHHRVGAVPHHQARPGVNNNKLCLKCILVWNFPTFFNGFPGLVN